MNALNCILLYCGYTCIEVEEYLMQSLHAFLFVCLFVSRCCFLTKIKIALKSYLELYFRPLITEFFGFVLLQFRIEEKINTKTLIDVSKDCGEVVTKVTLLRR